MNDLIVKTIVRWVIPFIQLFGVYVVFYGHVSFGGGFSGGALIGASLILYAVTFGLKASKKRVPHKRSQWMESLGILWYIALGLVGILTMDSFLGNKSAGFYMGEAGQLLSAGIIPLLTIGIGVKVASTMITLFQKIVEEKDDV
jgi:multicomponent Na+:H+ antiporter subunit B